MAALHHVLKCIFVAQTSQTDFCSSPSTSQGKDMQTKFRKMELLAFSCASSTFLVYAAGVFWV
jgi:hypothetical protein